MFFHRFPPPFSRGNDRRAFSLLLAVMLPCCHKNVTADNNDVVIGASETVRDDSVPRATTGVSVAASLDSDEAGAASSLGVAPASIAATLVASESSDAATTSTESPFAAPFSPLLPSDNQIAQLMVDLENGRGYVPFASEKYLYFSGSVLPLPSGILRLKKEPGAALETIVPDAVSNLGNFFYEDGMMYFLATTDLYRWPEDNSQAVERFGLDQYQFGFTSDKDHFLTVSYSSEYLTLFDKQTLEPHSILLEAYEPETGGGDFTVASDGQYVYCTRQMNPSRLYVVDKATELVTRYILTHPTRKTPIAMASFFVEGRKLYGNLSGSIYFTSIDTLTGQVDLLSVADGWGLGPLYRESGTDYAYFSDRTLGGNVYRFNIKTYAAEPLLAAHSLRLTSGFTMDSSYVYFVTATSGDVAPGIYRAKKLK